MFINLCDSSALCKSAIHPINKCRISLTQFSCIRISFSLYEMNENINNNKVSPNLNAHIRSPHTTHMDFASHACTNRKDPYIHFSLLLTNMYRCKSSSADVWVIFGCWYKQTLQSWSDAS